jgi:hypothetical protein
VKALLILLLALAACEPDNRPTMDPGQDCVSCHIAGGQADLERWTAAGTVFRAVDSGADEGVSDVHVLIRDDLGREVRLTTNSAGNFYTAEDLDSDAGLHVLLEYLGHCRAMTNTPKPTFTYELPDGTPPHPPVHGIGCNHCHADPPPPDALGELAPGRLAIPQYFESLGDVQTCPQGALPGN